MAAQQPQIITGLKQPESVAIGPGGKVYVSGGTGEYENANDGYISVLEGGKLRRFASGLDDPHGIKWYRDHLFVSDNMGMVWRIDAQGNAERFVDATDFPRKITNFNDLEIDRNGNLYLSDSGDWDGGGGAIYRITQQKKITPVITADDDVRVVSPNGLLMDGDHLLEVDYTTGILFRVDLERKSMEKVIGGRAHLMAWSGMRRGASSLPTLPVTGFCPDQAGRQAAGSHGRWNRVRRRPRDRSRWKESDDPRHERRQNRDHSNSEVSRRTGRIRARSLSSRG